MIDSKSTKQNASSAGGRSENLRLAEDGSSGRRFFSRSPPPPFVTRPRPIFARLQDGAGDRDLLFSRGFSAIKTPTNRLQAGYIEIRRFWSKLEYALSGH